MSRLFDGSNDIMTYDITGATHATGPNISFGTFLVVARILEGAGTWMSFIERVSGLGGDGGLGRHSNDSLYLAYESGAGENSSFDITSSDNWAVYAATKVTGSAAPILIKCPIGGSVSSATATSSIGNLRDSTELHLGGGPSTDFANIRLAAAACFQGVILSTTNVQTIADTKTTASILALGATWAVDDSDAFATDLVGAFDRTAITETADDADDPSGWVYGLGGATDYEAEPASAVATASGPTPLVSSLTRPYILTTIS